MGSSCQRHELGTEVRGKSKSWGWEGVVQAPEHVQASREGLDSMWRDHWGAKGKTWDDVGLGWWMSFLGKMMLCWVALEGRDNISIWRKVKSLYWILNSLAACLPICAGITWHTSHPPVETGAQGPDTNADTLAMNSKLSFVSEPGTSCLLPASMNLPQSVLLACKKGKISDLWLFSTVSMVWKCSSSSSSGALKNLKDKV